MFVYAGSWCDVRVKKPGLHVRDGSFGAALGAQDAEGSTVLVVRQVYISIVPAILLDSTPFKFISRICISYVCTPDVNALSM